MILLILFTFWALTLGFACAMARAAADGGGPRADALRGTSDSDPTAALNTVTTVQA